MHLSLFRQRFNLPFSHHSKKMTASCFPSLFPTINLGPGSLPPLPPNLNLFLPKSGQFRPPICVAETGPAHRPCPQKLGSIPPTFSGPSLSPSVSSQLSLPRVCCSSFSHLSRRRTQHAPASSVKLPLAPRLINTHACPCTAPEHVLLLPL